MTNSIKQPIKLAIAAMGGQGGGVLSSWMVALAESNEHYAQYTSVPGVAQRTGSTVYYIELFPQGISDDIARQPVMALMPSEGDVDIVVAGELVEAGRAVSRGLVTPDQTTLIVSTHRLYSQMEKEVLGDGRADPAVIIEGARQHAKEYIGFDMNQAAIDTGCVISAILFGALAGCERLPFKREQFEQVIRESGKAVESNLAGFNAGYKHAQESLNAVKGGASTPDASAPEEVPYKFPTARNQQLQDLLTRVEAELPSVAHEFTVEGIRRLIDYQDLDYAIDYVDRMCDITQLDAAHNGESHSNELSKEIARYLALWMSYEDTIRVADLKIRKKRFTRYKDHVKAKQGDVAHVVEFMHPRLEEIADTMPRGLGRLMLTFGPLKSFVSFFCSERKVTTSKLSGFLLLYITARFKGIRRSTLRFERESERMNDWLNLVKSTLEADYKSAVEIAKCQRLIKGYGDTHDRGWANYSSIVASLPTILTRQGADKVISDLRSAALAEESGAQLSSQLSSIAS